MAEPGGVDLAGHARDLLDRIAYLVLARSEPTGGPGPDDHRARVDDGRAS